MIESVADIEAVLAAEIPSFVCGWLVVDNDVAAKSTKWVGVEIEGSVEVILRR